jgi:hypothetical protein
MLRTYTSKSLELIREITEALIEKMNEKERARLRNGDAREHEKRNEVGKKLTSFL